MVSGRLQEKNEYYYMVLSYTGADGKRKQPWHATGLPVKGNKRKLCGNCYNHQYDGYVFVDEMGNPIQPDRVSDGFARLLKAHGLRHIRFHDLRHSCASLLLKQGVPMKQIQEWLGHSDISTTANIYAHLDSQSNQLSAATMEQALPLPEELPENRW